MNETKLRDTGNDMTQTTGFEILARSSFCEIIISLTLLLKISQFLYYNSEELPTLVSYCGPKLQVWPEP